MELRRKSWHAKLNRYIFGQGYLDNVDCLCPYFWGTLLALVVLPLFALAKGIVSVASKTNVEIPNISTETKDKISNILLYSGLFGISTVVTILVGAFIIKFGLWEVLKWLGIGAGVTMAVISVIWLAWSLKQRYYAWAYENKIVKPNLLIEFVKAKKNKHCPMVRWID